MYSTSTKENSTSACMFAGLSLVGKMTDLTLIERLQKKIPVC